MQSIYLETTIPSYAVGQSDNIIVAGRQAITRRFWEEERHKFKLWISSYVIQECKCGATDYAGKRLELLRGIPVLPPNETIEPLAKTYMQSLSIPDKSRIDAMHVAVCVIYEIDILLSWNCKHLGGITMGKLQRYNDSRGLWTPMLITPEAIIDYEGEVD